MSNETVRKKKINVPRNRKVYWRKHADINDVENFLDEKRREERIGGPFKNKKNEELFCIDTGDLDDKVDAALKLKLTKKQRALLPPRCLEALNPMTAVPDPIVKRNRVRTKEERKSSLRKFFDERKRLSGHIPKKILDARVSRVITLRKKQMTPKCQVFKKDIWSCKDDEKKEELQKLNWLTTDTIRHNLANTGSLKVVIPGGIRKKKSVLPTIGLPHPGTSYNPSLSDHQALLKTVVEQELKTQKEEDHIKRVTSDMFNKVTPSEKTTRWIEEMSQGLPQSEEIKVEDEEVEEKNDYKAINPPVNFLKKKTRQQRRKQKLEREATLKRKEAKVEKKKKADLYKLKFIDHDITKTENIQKKNVENRQKLAALNVGRTKRLGCNQFEDQETVFSRTCELKGNLRMINKQGNILVDRFFSMQKRNMIVPSKKRIGLKKAKVKVFTKASHKIENVEIKK